MLNSAKAQSYGTARLDTIFVVHGIQARSPAVADMLKNSTAEQQRICSRR
jgi:hypothetical protein